MEICSLLIYVLVVYLHQFTLRLPQPYLHPGAKKKEKRKEKQVSIVFLPYSAYLHKNLYYTCSTYRTTQIFNKAKGREL